MSLEGNPQETLAAGKSTIIHPGTTKLGRRIMSGDANADVNFCIDSKLDEIRGDGKCSPGSSFVWGQYKDRSDEASAARLKGNGIRAVTYHQNCGMAKVAAEKALGHTVSQSDADEWAKQETIKGAKKYGFGYVGIGKKDMNSAPDNKSIHVIRPGVKYFPTTGFRLNAITQDPVEGIRIAHAVAASRGETDVTTYIHCTSREQGEAFRRRIPTNIKTEIVVSR